MYGNDLVATFNESAYFGVHILELSKVLMHKFHYDYIKNKYGNNSRLIFTDMMYEAKKLKEKIFMKILVRIKKCLLLAIISLSQNINMIQINYLLIKGWFKHISCW